ncbi:nodulation protein NfeD [Thalassotalea nanhaiensis]|uniref:Nodulation protein NfeD n=1 Tax=Thalassotalea nanhaiensis TaxID=3065648 RepID=A0ABY9TMG3_9GAMM|nr:nodulation protein NfeD [Colwelliaceae bacterium SQ345]
MLRWLVGLLLIVSFVGKATTEPPKISPSPVATQTVPVLSIKGAIGPAVSDYLVTEIANTNHNKSSPLLIITLDTPGGLSSSLRDINMAIMASSIPIACLVYPQGARAASAGTYILYACHIAAMSTATTLGAATPVSIGAPTGADKQEEKTNSPTAMEKKVLNDAIAYIRSLAQLRGRNEKWAVLAVREAATLTAKEALDKNVINLIAQSPAGLVQKLHGYKVVIDKESQQLNLANAQLTPIKADWRNNFIATITDPNIAYILMLIGIYGLLLEFYSPGIGIAGITGGISLLIALYAFQLLPISFTGAGLLILGLILLIAESFAPSFGILGIGGVIAFVLGSIFLIDTDQAHFQISIPLIAAVAFISTLFFVFTLGYLWRSRNSKVVSGQEELIGANALVEHDFTGLGYVIVNGERWAAQSQHELTRGQSVQINSIDGLTLRVSELKDKE